MKRFYFIITGLLCCAVVFTSCSDNDNFDKEKFFGNKIVEVAIETEKGNSIMQAKGLNSEASDFDQNYDPSYIYMHKKGSDEVIKFPTYPYICDYTLCQKGFRYHIDVDEAGNATITPLDMDGDLLTESLYLAAGDSVYFSSEEYNVWELPDDLITSEGTDFKYHRQKDINKEIYRSSSNYSIENLTRNNNNLSMQRACAGFKIIGLFFSKKDITISGSGHQFAIMSSETFEDVMGSPVSEWYIKVEVGGNSFTNAFDLSTNLSVGDKAGGYYTSGDSTLYEQGSPDESKYLPIAARSFGTADVTYDGYGYYTSGNGNVLLTPVTGQDVNVYIYIKHWTGGAEGPDDNWLLDDNGALRTKVNLAGSGYQAPENNSFYIMGLLMDIEQFKTAWEEAGGDAGAAGAYTNGASMLSKNVKNGVRDVTLKGSKVVFEAY